MPGPPPQGERSLVEERLAIFGGSRYRTVASVNRIKQLGARRRLAELDLLHRGDQLFVGRRRSADRLAALLRVSQREHQRLDFLERAAIALRGAREFLGVLAGDVLEPVALRLAD